MKKRASHVGVVLSFVVFVTFAIFLYSILEPTIKTGRSKQALLDYLEVELIAKISSDLTSVIVSGVHVTEGSPDCLSVADAEAGIESGGDVIVKDKLGEIVNFLYVGDTLKIEWGNDDVFFKVYYSKEDFEDYPASSSACEVATIESVRTKEYIFMTKAEEVVNSVEGDEVYYNSLKNELKVPAGTEFGFGFTYADGNMIEANAVDVTTDIYAEEIPIQYTDKDANIKSGFINIKVW